ncbi:aldehyde dehydrogenase family protein [Novosphingobium taihuense]|uniref:Acyl-CoA reductase-like NAD-dependent aldehyde dehydrogenase n=1 Tax=Novosphingobium taihuense TaxID=260085 RepID=A0A7W7ABZ3_9SPHN|nr:aldehyde dehydrogenase family protein [Novosphingobium taihuense]MBB4614218.1 acyl-CoA reductase-like NAD-dependent aldehyde dehydrogenase [Novosphingobium taihuense]TWH87065.1 acyl-CoA reductase-like NAD-dependent aldehyde dehydrogenase [Novosphingobium taihuense]
MIVHPDADLLPRKALLIGDRRFDTASGGTHRHIYAATGRPTADIPLAGAAEVDLAVEAARNASTIWSQMPRNERRDCLIRMAHLLREHAAELTQLSVIDNSIAIATQQYGGHVAADLFLYNAGWTDKIGGDVIPTWPGNALDYTLDEPFGVVAVIIPWNGPVYALGMVLAPALAAGNTVVVKPPELAPYAALRFAELCLEAGMPPGTVNMIPGGPEAGAALTSHPGVDKISFTGSGNTARHILTSAQKRLTPVQLELGGKSASIVFDDADLEAWSPYGLAGIVNNVGQGCINPTRVVVQRGIYAEVLARLEAAAVGLRIGDPTDPTTVIGPVVDDRAVTRIMGMIDRANASGARLLTGGARGKGDLAEGYFIEPTVFADVAPDSELAQHEVFGPVLAVTPFDTEDEAIKLANGTEFSLAAYAWTRDLKRAHRCARSLVAGNVWINGFTGIPGSAPFGGMGESGVGRLGGIYGIREFTRPKNVWIGLD